MSTSPTGTFNTNLPSISLTAALHIGLRTTIFTPITGSPVLKLLMTPVNSTVRLSDLFSGFPTTYMRFSEVALRLLGCSSSLSLSVLFPSAHPTNAGRLFTILRFFTRNTYLSEYVVYPKSVFFSNSFISVCRFWASVFTFTCMSFTSASSQKNRYPVFCSICFNTSVSGVSEIFICCAMTLLHMQSVRQSIRNVLFPIFVIC